MGNTLNICLKVSFPVQATENMGDEGVSRQRHDRVEQGGQEPWLGCPGPRPRPLRLRSYSVERTIFLFF